MELMKIISNYLGCEAAVYSSNNMSVLSVKKFEEVVNIIIPMFKLHPILGVKAKDFSDFVLVSELMKKGEHLNAAGFSEILRIKGSMNKGRKIELFEEDQYSSLPATDSPESKYELYMYNRDKTILYHYTNNIKKFSEYLSIYKATLDKHLCNGSYYLGKYLFSREFSSSVLEFKNFSLSELNSMLIKDRVNKFSNKIGKS